MSKSGLYGDWETVGPKLKVIEDSVSSNMIDEAKKLGNDYNNAIRKHVKQQDLPLAALAEKTVLRKGHEKWYFETGNFLDKLSVRVYYKGKKTSSVRVGALPDRKYNDYLSMEDLALMLELGTSTIPSRPLFRKTNEEFADKFRNLGKESSKIYQIFWNKKVAIGLGAALGAYFVAKNTILKKSELTDI